MRLKSLLLWGFLGLATAAGGAVAAPAAVVEVVQAPAWVDRGARTEPAAPGLAVRDGDVVRTGDGGRVVLRLAEGSTVKLGAGARMAFHTRSLRPERVLKAALDVATGAFRFTTDVLRRVRGERDVTIRVATATVGIRGTDVWGKADKDRELVALIEGRIELARGGQALDLSAMQYMEAPKGGVAAIKELSPELLGQLARETEIAAGDGGRRAGGRWRLAAGEFATQAEALERYDALRDAGFAARVRPVAADGGEGGEGASGWRYRVSLPGYASAAEAAAGAARLKALAGIETTPAR